jgi:hypothetical protein
MYEQSKNVYFSKLLPDNGVLNVKYFIVIP